MASFETVLRTPDLGPGTMREVHAHGHDIAVANIGQTYYAFDPTCPVDGTNLAREGRIDGDTIICPGDDAHFDIRTGARVDGDGDDVLRRHEIRIDGNDVCVGAGQPSGGATADTD